MSNHLSSLPRRSLTARQVQAVEQLLAAAVAELNSVGHEELSIRAVAVRAGVSPATAYTYFASKDHLFAELFSRLLTDGDGPELVGEDPAARLRQTMQHLADVLAASPAMTAAATKSLLGSDSQVSRLRVVIGATFRNRFRDALGETADRAVLDAVTLAFFGALLEAGMGFVSYAELGDRLDPVLTVIMEGRT